jgi:hypothetical protein
MSLLTGQYLDGPTHNPGSREYEHSQAGKGSKRRFFQSGARWDETLEQVIARREAYDKTIKPGTLMDVSVAEENMMEEELNE